MYVSEDHVHDFQFTGRTTSPHHYPVYACACGQQKIELLERRPRDTMSQAAAAAEQGG